MTELQQVLSNPAMVKALEKLMEEFRSRSNILAFDLWKDEGLRSAQQAQSELRGVLQFIERLQELAGDDDA